jgi:mannose-6-phosphate isomerase
MRKIEKPWGYEEIWAETDKYLGKILTILPGQRLSLQYHEKKEETVYVMSGKLIVWLSEDENNKLILNKGTTYHVKPGQVHRFGAPKGRVLTKLIEVSTPELDDVVRIKDDYQR